MPVIAPYSFVTPSGEPSGIDVNTWEIVAQNLHVDIEFKIAKHYEDLTIQVT